MVCKVKLNLSINKIIPISVVFCPTPHFNKLFYWLLNFFLAVGYFLKTALGQKNTEIGIK